MFKTTVLFSLIVWVLLTAPSAYAGKVELTTYYPAPMGEYKTLSTTENATFATTAGSVNMGSTTNHTVLAVDNTLTLAPVSGAAGTQSGGTEGSLRYSSDAGGAGVGGMLYKNNSGWQTFGGGGGGVQVKTGTISTSGNGGYFPVVVSFTPKGAICATSQIGRFGNWGHFYAEHTISGNTVTFHIYCTEADCGTRADYQYMIIGE